MARSALSILAGEARKRGLTYGKLVSAVPEEELRRIVYQARLRDALRLNNTVTKGQTEGDAYGQSTENPDR